MANVKKKNVWKTIEGLTDRARELIDQGILCEDKGEDKLCSTLNAEFSEAFTKLGVNNLSKKQLSAKLEDLIWTKERLQFIRYYIAFDLDLSEVYGQLSFITAPLIKRKIKKLRGESRPGKATPFSPGIGRLITSEDIKKLEKFSLDNPTFEKPFHVKVASPDNFQFSVPNAAHIGTKHNRIADENPLGCVLNEAEKNGDDFVIITGSLIDLIDVRKSQGHLTTHRAMTSGINFDPDILDPQYRDEAIRIMKERKPGEIAFETLSERLANVIKGLKNKITHRSDGTPVYSGKVFITLSVLEEELITAAAHYEAAYLVIVNRNRVCIDRRAKEIALAVAKARGGGNEADIAFLEEEISRLLSIEKRMVQTNVMHAERQRYMRALRSHIVRSLEEAIPNSKIIGIGTSYIEVGGKIIEIRQSRDLRSSENLLDKYLKNKAGARALSGELADVVLLAGPFNVNHRWAVYETTDNNGEPASTFIWQLPSLLDKKFLERGLLQLIRKGSPFERLIRDPRFEPGLFRLRYVQGLWASEPITVENLKRSFLKKKTRNHETVPYINFFIHTDDHTGHPWKEYYYDASNGRWLGHVPAVIEILRQGFLNKGKQVPIHGYFMLDDGVQGHHFPTQSQPHHHAIAYSCLEKEFHQIRLAAQKADTPEFALKKLDELHERALEQFRIRGDHWPQLQIEEFFRRVIERNLDFFASILKRDTRSNVHFRGVSDILGEPYDSRDIAPISFGTGNHFGNTVLNELTEGFFYADKLRTALRYMNGNKCIPKDKLDNLVRAPLFGNTHIGLGQVSVPNGYEWGIYLRSNPSRKSGQNGDPLREAAKNVMERGDFSRIFRGHHTLHFSGDIHRFGYIRLSNATILSCAPGTDNDPYGERGFSLNNVGNFVVGVPAYGPDSGPIRVVVFNHDFVRKYFKNPFEIDWDKVLPNPA